MAHHNTKQGIDFSVSTQINLKSNMMLAQNQELIQKLNKKIDRRLNIGYYCQVPTSRKQRNYQSRKIYIAKGAQLKKKYPIIKRKKKDQKLVYSDCQQNTDFVQLADDFQNTSKIYTEKKEEPKMEDNEAQWSYEAEKVSQALQCNVDVIDGSMQYEAEELVQLQDASVQYQDPGGILEDLEPKEEPKIVIPQIVLESREVQCQKIEKSQKCLQFDEIKPKIQQQNVQIDLPDLKHLQKLQNLEQRLQHTQRQKQRQEKLNKTYKSRLQMLKLKEEITNIQKQIEIAEINDKNQQQKRERQQEIVNQQRIFSQFRKRDLKAINQHFQKRMSSIITRLKSKEKINRSESKPLNLSLISKIQQDKQQTKQISQREEIQKLQNDLKQEMKKRMRYEQDFQENQDKLQSFSRLVKIQSDIQITSMRMKNLFPNPESVDKCFAGTIIKNISKNFSHIKPQISQKRDYRLAKITRAFCQRRLEVNSEMRQQNEEELITKKSNEDLDFKIKLKDIRKSSIHFSSKQRKPMQQIAKTSRYVKSWQAKTLKMQQIRSLDEKIKLLLKSQTCIKYLYKEEQKMKLGIELFKILSPDLVILHPIDIFKLKEGLVYKYIQKKITHFIIFYHSLQYIFYGQAQQSIKKQLEFYANPIFYKNNWGIQYCSLTKNYNGQFKNGEKHGFGLQILGKNVYEGFFQNSKKIGKGKNTFQNGDYYQGQFKNSLAHGEGIYKWQNGEKYEGFFQTGKRNGYGKHLYLNGDVFEGFYLNDLKQGKGMFKWSDGKVYEGYFKNDLKCGQGRLMNADGSYFIGVWNNDICTFVCRKIGTKPTKINQESITSKVKI